MYWESQRYLSSIRFPTLGGFTLPASRQLLEAIVGKYMSSPHREPHFLTRYLGRIILDNYLNLSARHTDPPTIVHPHAKVLVRIDPDNPDTYYTPD